MERAHDLPPFTLISPFMLVITYGPSPSMHVPMVNYSNSNILHNLKLLSLGNQDLFNSILNMIKINKNLYVLKVFNIEMKEEK